jgi:hypothetical protein
MANEQAKVEEGLDYLAQYAGQGFEGIRAEDYTTPFLKILQKGCAEVDPANAQRIAGAEAGMFMNTQTKRLYGKEITLIPLAENTAWMVWKPRDSGGGLVGRYLPDEIKTTGSPYEDGMKDEAGNDVVETMNFLVLIVGHLEDGPLVFPLSKTGIRHGKNWNTDIKNTRLPNGEKAPYFACKWKLKLVPNQEKNYSWFQIGTRTKTEVTNKDEKGSVMYITREDFGYVRPSWEARIEYTRRADFAALGRDGVEARAIEDKTSEDGDY